VLGQRLQSALCCCFIIYVICPLGYIGAAPRQRASSVCDFYFEVLYGFSMFCIIGIVKFSHHNPYRRSYLRSSSDNPRSSVTRKRRAGCLVGRILHLRLLVDPVELGVLVGDELVLVEPEGDLLLGVLDAVGAVADVAADVLLRGECRTHAMCIVLGTYDGVVTTDGARRRVERVGSTEDGCTQIVSMGGIDG